MHIEDLPSPYSGTGRSIANAVEGPSSHERDEGPSACRGGSEEGDPPQLPGLRAGPTSKGTCVTTDQLIIALLCAAFVAYVAKVHPTVVPALTLAAAVAAVIVAVMLT